MIKGWSPGLIELIAMKRKAPLIIAVLLTVAGASYLAVDRATPVERMLANGSPIAKRGVGPAQQDWQLVPRGTLEVSLPTGADERIARLAERLRQKGMGRVSPPAMPSPVMPKESLIPKQPVLSPEQQKELNAILNGPYKDVAYLGNPDNATIKMLASPDLAWLPPGEQLGAEAKSRRFFTNNKSLLRIGAPDQELQLAKTETMTDGTQVLRFQQTFGGLEVWPAQLVTNVAQDGRLTTMTGAYVPTPEGLVLNAAVATGEAVRVAWAHVGLLPPNNRPGPVLKIYAENGAAKELAYEVKVEGGMRDSQVFVSAISGKVLKAISKVCNVAVTGSGVGVVSSTPLPLNLWKEGASFLAKDTTKTMYNAGTGDGVIQIYNNNNTGPSGTFVPAASSSQFSFSDPDAASALYCLGKTYDFFMSEFSRNSFDNAGASMIAVVRFAETPGTPMQNAFWSGAAGIMGFGNGDKLAGALDVIGHEMTHAVVEKTSDLVYEGQPGALNESFSDIFGEGTEWKVAGNSDWKIGTNLTTMGVLRDMVAPENHQQPSRMSAFVRTTDDHGGVHINSGIPNYAFYLLVEGLPGGGIGRQKAHQIFYRTLTTKLSKNSDFQDMRAGAVQSAKELYGVGSAESLKVMAAFDAVEIYDPSIVVSTLPDQYAPVAGVDSYLYLYPSGGAYYLARREAAIDGAGNFNWVSTYPLSMTTRPSVSGDGSMVAFVTLDYDFGLAQTSSTFGSQQQTLGFPGIFNSVALSPDETKFACIARNSSTGIPESKLYLGNLSTNTSEVINLNVPAIDGVSSTPFTAVDEIDFSPDGSLLAFDGFSSTTLSDGTVLSGWSIYIINLRTRAIYSLLKQLPGVTIRRPSFSRIGACRLVFELIEGGRRYVGAWDLMNGSFGEVRNDPDLGVGAYPRYSAADDKMMYTGTYLSGGYYYPIQAFMRMLSDRVSPDNSQLPTAVQYDGRNGSSYRRGIFNGPPLVTVAALNTSVKGGSSGKFRVSRVAGDQTIRLPVSFTPIGTARPGADYARLDTVAVLPAGVSYVDVTVNSLIPAGGASKALTLSIDPQFHYTTPENPTAATMTLTAATPSYAEWAAANGMSAVTKGADDDGDGYSNLFEYALGANPTTMSDIRQATEVAEASGQKYIQIALSRSLIRPGITWSLERSADMVNWTAATSSTIADTPSQLVLRDTLPLNGNEKRFIRVRVTEQ
jgi:Zn-dependent metalloprotease